MQGCIGTIVHDLRLFCQRVVVQYRNGGLLFNSSCGGDVAADVCQLVLWVIVRVACDHASAISAAASLPCRRVSGSFSSLPHNSVQFLETTYM